MNLTVRHWRRSAIRVGVLSAALVAAPLMATAGESSGTAAKPGPSIRTSVEKVVATQTLKSSQKTARAQQGGTTDLGSSSFFRSPGGIIALVALAAGIGYTIYSTNNDRVKSPAK